MPGQPFRHRKMAMAMAMALALAQLVQVRPLEPALDQPFLRKKMPPGLVQLALSGSFVSELKALEPGRPFRKKMLVEPVGLVVPLVLDRPFRHHKKMLMELDWVAGQV